jgi:hypothetical protein
VNYIIDFGSMIRGERLVLLIVIAITTIRLILIIGGLYWII